MGKCRNHISRRQARDSLGRFSQSPRVPPSGTPSSSRTGASSTPGAYSSSKGPAATPMVVIADPATGVEAVAAGMEGEDGCYHFNFKKMSVCVIIDKNQEVDEGEVLTSKQIRNMAKVFQRVLTRKIVDDINCKKARK
ncbi:unnamed protein product [Urochloa humidicola]